MSMAEGKEHVSTPPVCTRVLPLYCRSPIPAKIQIQIIGFQKDNQPLGLGRKDHGLIVLASALH